MTQFMVIGVDASAALNLAASLGYDATGIAALLADCENGIVAALNEKLTSGLK